MGGPRTDFTFPRAIQAHLAESGRPADVQTITMTSEQTHKILGTWQREILGFSPDVVVLVYGHQESIHLFLPRWLERHANSLKAKPRFLSTLYRERLLKPVWMSLAKLQARLDTLIDPTIRRGRPRRVAADLERYITHVQKVGSPLVLLLELLPVAERVESWFPGMTPRIEVMNQTISDMVRRLDLPNVRYVRLREFVDKYAEGSQGIATPDGFHFSPLLHREIGRALAEQIQEWAETQPHLTLEPAAHEQPGRSRR